MSNYVTNVVDRVLDAVIHAEEKHGSIPKDVLHQIAILSEEVLEATQEAFKLYAGNNNQTDYEYEITQVAAVCLRILIDFEEERNRNDSQES